MTEFILNVPALMPTVILGLTEWVIKQMEYNPSSIEMELVEPEYEDINFKDTVQQFCTKAGYGMLTFKDEETLIMFKLKFGL